MKAECIIFDLDGTLIDSIGGIAYSCNHVLETYGYPTKTTQEYADLIGGGVRGTITNALPESVTDESLITNLVKEFMAFYAKNYLVDTDLYEGIKDLLDALEQLNIPIAINTNKHASISYPIIEALFTPWNLLGYRAPDGIIPLKPDPGAAIELLKKTGASPENCLYIGDSEVDIKTAHNAGMKSIVVSWGYRNIKDLIKLNPDAVLYAPKDLMSLIGE